MLVYGCIAAAMEDTKEPRGVLLHVEDDGPVRAAEARQGGGGRVQAEASVHSQLVSVCTTLHHHTYVYTCLILTLPSLFNADNCYYTSWNIVDSCQSGSRFIMFAFGYLDNSRIFLKILQPHLS